MGRRVGVGLMLGAADRDVTRVATTDAFDAGVPNPWESAVAGSFLATGGDGGDSPEGGDPFFLPTPDAICLDHASFRP